MQLEYNGFGQLVADYQSHAGAVDVNTTPNVQYTDESGTANTIGPTAMLYPNGREITYSYGVPACPVPSGCWMPISCC